MGGEREKQKEDIKRAICLGVVFVRGGVPIHAKPVVVEFLTQFGDEHFSQKTKHTESEHERYHT